jgi:thiol-disulfide isomerase/thioredoxin
MQKRFLIAPVFLIFTVLLSGQVPVMDFEQLRTRLETESDSVYVVNFWATWCVPCVKELPEFEKINANYSGLKVKVLLISLDNPRHMQSRVSPFIEEHGLKSEIILLDDPRSNNWIPRVDASWSGSIPATLVFTNVTRSFYEKAFTYDELEKIVRQELN